MKYTLLFALLLSASCARKFTAVPPYLIIKASTAKCEHLPDRVLCSYTVEDRRSLSFQHIEFLKKIWPSPIDYSVK